MFQNKDAVYSLNTPKSNPGMLPVPGNHSKVYLGKLVTSFSIKQLLMPARAEINQVTISSFQVSILDNFWRFIKFSTGVSQKSDSN